MYGMDFERTHFLNAPPPSKVRRRKESRIKKLQFVSNKLQDTIMTG